MFSRFIRPYRRFRKYARKRLGRRGISFVQTGSKARYGTRSSVTWPFSKKRTSAQAFSQNLSEDDWKDLGMNPPQSNGAAIAPLSMVRFKNPASDCFDYHHFVRRSKQADFIITGATGAEVTGNINITAASAISDFTNLAAIYGRYRITRVIWQFLPQITSWVQSSSAATKPLFCAFVNRHSDYTAQVPGSYADAIDDLSTTIYDAGQPIVIDYAPFCMRTLDVVDDSPATQVVNDGAPAPWIETSESHIVHLGGQVTGKVALNTGASGVISQQFSVILTVYFDMDNQK